MIKSSTINAFLINMGWHPDCIKQGNMRTLNDAEVSKVYSIVRNCTTEQQLDICYEWISRLCIIRDQKEMLLFYVAMSERVLDV